jgi:hypothetical protein
MSFLTAIAKLKYWDNTDRPDIGEATKQLALSIEPLVIPKFTSVAARDAGLTAAVLAKMPLAGEGAQCYVDNIGPQLYNGAAWVPMHSGVAEYQEGTGSAAVNVPNATWTLLLTNVAGASSGGATTIDSQTVLFPGGVYSIDCNVQWSSNGSGRRLMGISNSIGDDPDDTPYYISTMSAASGILYQHDQFTYVNTSGTSRAALWVYQDSGTNLSVTRRRTFVQKVA